MAVYIQSYQDGYIAREGNKYQYVVEEKVVATYNSVEELAAAQRNDGKQDQESKSSTQAQPAAKPARKAKAKATKATK